MIKFRGESEGKSLFGFGLSEANIQRLKDGDPIMVDLSVMGGDGKVLIFYGKTEHEMAMTLKECGAIGPQTEIRIQENTHGG